MKINFTSDAILRGPAWANVIDHLVGTMFETNWEVYSLCISIGMMYDEQIDSDDMDSEDYDAEPRYVPRNVLSHTQNAELLEIMLQSALVTTKHLDMSEDERLELAFGEESQPDFNPITFLTKYANAGILKLNECISDTDMVETMESIMTFLRDAYEGGVSVIDNSMELEDN